MRVCAFFVSVCPVHPTDAGQCLQEFPGHKGGVNALAALTATAAGSNTHSLLLSAGKDHKLRLWQLQAAAASQQNGVSSKKAGSSSGGNAAVQCVAEYEGHQEAVQSVAASPAGSLCCSGGWDGQLLLWRTGERDTCLGQKLVLIAIASSTQPRTWGCAPAIACTVCRCMRCCICSP